MWAHEQSRSTSFYPPRPYCIWLRKRNWIGEELIICSSLYALHSTLRAPCPIRPLLVFEIFRNPSQFGNISSRRISFIVLCRHILTVAGSALELDTGAVKSNSTTTIKRVIDSIRPVHISQIVLISTIHSNSAVIPTQHLKRGSRLRRPGIACGPQHRRTHLVVQPAVREDHERSRDMVCPFHHR